MTENGDWPLALTLTLILVTLIVSLALTTIARDREIVTQADMYGWGIVK